MAERPPGPPATVLEGSVERITYVNEETGYTVLKLQPSGKQHLVTVVGTLPGVNPGEGLRLTGRWTVHPTHGKQFEVHDYQVTLPATVEGLRKYLGSGLVRGVGPITAERIVDHFGLETLYVLEQQPQRLREVPGVGPMRSEAIAQAWEEQKAIKEVMLFLASHKVSTSLAVRIYKQYGDEAVRVVREDPYRLAREVFGIGFKTADRIAANLGMSKTSQERAMAGLVHVLWEATEEGHVYLPKDELFRRGETVLETTEAPLEEALTLLTAHGQTTVEDVDGVSAVYVAPLARAEDGLARRLHALQHAPRDRLALFQQVDFTRAFAWLRDRYGVDLSPEQAESVRLALTTKVAVLTGGPGTGKTTTVRAIIRLLKAKGRSYILAAPTGKAARRLAEATGEAASTVHRLLGLGFDGRAAHDQHNPLGADMVIVDETSMLDVLVANSLVKAVPPGAHLLLVGDADQLPSVGPGNVLRDVIASGRVPAVRLQTIFRQAQQSGIVVNAHRINHGEMPQWRGFPDFFFIREDDPAKAAELVRDLVAHRLPRRYGYHPIRDIQVLTPMHAGALGVANLNRVLQDTLNPAASGRPERPVGSRIYRQGDKVLCIRNDYSRLVFNGDGGEIERIDVETQSAHVRLDDGRVVTYQFHELDELIHAYALSVHKSQGSEFEAVVIPLHTQHYLLLRRNLLYTAITRARRLVVLVGSPRAIAIAVKNGQEQERYTGLRWRLGTLASSPSAPSLGAPR